jgi:hypothetical protein
MIHPVIFFPTAYIFIVHHEIINTGEPQSALKYPDQLIGNLLGRYDHIICVLLIKHSLKVCQ